MRLRLLILICTLCSVAKVNAWEPSNDSLRVIANELLANKPDFAIEYLPKVINYLEENESEFVDTTYVGLSIDLSSAYLMKGDIVACDHVLDQTQNQLSKRGITKIFPLFDIEYGARQYLLANFEKAAYHLERGREAYKDKRLTNEYMAALSMLISCYNSIDEQTQALKIINEATNLLIQYKDCYNALSKVQVLQSSAVYFGNHGDNDLSLRTLKNAFDIAKNDSSCQGSLNRIAINLGVSYLDEEDYTQSQYYFSQVRQDLLTSNEKIELYNSLYSLYYLLGDEEFTVKNAILYSNKIKEIIQYYSSNLSRLAFDNIWTKESLQLLVPMGALHKFQDNPEINSMCYDNALFIKNIVYDTRKNIRNYIDLNQQTSETYNKIKNIRSQMYLMSSNDSNVVKHKERLEELENKLKREVGYAKTKNHEYIWQNVAKELADNECAIEIISQVGLPNSREPNPKLELGALIIDNDCVCPKYVSLCYNDTLSNVILNSLVNQEEGINSLYCFESQYTLYNLLWKNLESFVKDKSTIIISPTIGSLQINWGFIPCPDGKYLNEKYDIRIVSSTANALSKQNKKYEMASLFGNMYYDKVYKSNTSAEYRGLILDYENSRGNFKNLNYTKAETDSIQDILLDSGIKVSMKVGGDANEDSFKSLDGHSPSIVHISSHAFYLVGFDKFSDYFNSLTPYIARDESMIRSGILFNDANNALNSTDNQAVQNDGVLTAEEISMMDLSKTDMVVLSACESILGCSTEGLGGLPKAFKLAGVHSVMGSLWKVSDIVTSKLMIEFYRNLCKGIDKYQALKSAQYKIKETYPDPYYWAAFIIID